MAVVEKQNIIEQGLGLLLHQWKNKPNITGILRSYLTQLQKLEDTFHQLNDERSVYTAVGAQLDVIGLLVNEQRIGRVDSEYREAILNRVASNRASGTAPDIKRIAKILTGSTIAHLFEHFPGATYLYVNRVATLGSAKALQQAHVGGVRTRVLWHEDGEDVFTAGYNGGVFLTVPLVTEDGERILVDTEQGQFGLSVGGSSFAPGGDNTLTSLVPGATEFKTVDNRGKLASIAPTTAFDVQTGYIIDHDGNYIVDSSGENIRYVNF